MRLRPTWPDELPDAVAQQEPRGLERAAGQHHVAGPHLALGRVARSGPADRSR